MEKEYVILYTHQKQKKAKTWHDGVLKHSGHGTKAVLYDEKGSKLDSIHIRVDAIMVGEQLESDRYFILIEEIKGPQTDTHTQEPPQIDSRKPAQIDNKNKPAVPRCAGLKRKNSGFMPPRMVKQTRQDSPDCLAQNRQRDKNSQNQWNPTSQSRQQFNNDFPTVTSKETFSNGTMSRVNTNMINLYSRIRKDDPDGLIGNSSPLSPCSSVSPKVLSPWSVYGSNDNSPVTRTPKDAAHIGNISESYGKKMDSYDWNIESEDPMNIRKSSLCHGKIDAVIEKPVLLDSTPLQGNDELIKEGVKPKRSVGDIMNLLRKKPLGEDGKQSASEMAKRNLITKGVNHVSDLKEVSHTSTDSQSSANDMSVENRTQRSDTRIDNGKETATHFSEIGNKSKVDLVLLEEKLCVKGPNRNLYTKDYGGKDDVMKSVSQENSVSLLKSPFTMDETRTEENNIVLDVETRPKCNVTNNAIENNTGEDELFNSGSFCLSFSPFHEVSDIDDNISESADNNIDGKEKPDNICQQVDYPDNMQIDSEVDDIDKDVPVCTLNATDHDATHVAIVDASFATEKKIAAEISRPNVVTKDKNVPDFTEVFHSSTDHHFSVDEESGQNGSQGSDASVNNRKEFVSGKYSRLDKEGELDMFSKKISGKWANLNRYEDEMFEHTECMKNDEWEKQEGTEPSIKGSLIHERAEENSIVSDIETRPKCNDTNKDIESNIGDDELLSKGNFCLSFSPLHEASGSDDDEPGSTGNKIDVNEKLDGICQQIDTTDNLQISSEIDNIDKVVPIGIDNAKFHFTNSAESETRDKNTAKIDTPVLVPPCQSPLVMQCSGSSNKAEKTCSSPQENCDSSEFNSIADSSLCLVDKNIWSKQSINNETVNSIVSKMEENSEKRIDTEQYGRNEVYVNDMKEKRSTTEERTETTDLCDVTKGSHENVTSSDGCHDTLDTLQLTKCEDKKVVNTDGDFLDIAEHGTNEFDKDLLHGEDITHDENNSNSDIHVQCLDNYTEESYFASNCAQHVSEEWFENIETDAVEVSNDTYLPEEAVPPSVEDAQENSENCRATQSQDTMDFSGDTLDDDFPNISESYILSMKRSGNDIECRSSRLDTDKSDDYITYSPSSMLNRISGRKPSVNKEVAVDHESVYLSKQTNVAFNDSTALPLKSTVQISDCSEKRLTETIGSVPDRRFGDSFSTTGAGRQMDVRHDYFNMYTGKEFDEHGDNEYCLTENSKTGLQSSALDILPHPSQLFGRHLKKKIRQQNLGEDKSNRNHTEGIQLPDHKHGQNLQDMINSRLRGYQISGSIVSNALRDVPDTPMGSGGQTCVGADITGHSDVGMQSPFQQLSDSDINECSSPSFYVDFINKKPRILGHASNVVNTSTTRNVPDVCSTALYSEEQPLRTDGNKTQEIPSFKIFIDWSTKVFSEYMGKSIILMQQGIDEDDLFYSEMYRPRLMYKTVDSLTSSSSHVHMTANQKYTSKNDISSGNEKPNNGRPSAQISSPYSNLQKRMQSQTIPNSSIFYLSDDSDNHCYIVSQSCDQSGSQQSENKENGKETRKMCSTNKYKSTQNTHFQPASISDSQSSGEYFLPGSRRKLEQQGSSYLQENEIYPQTKTASVKSFVDSCQRENGLASPHLASVWSLTSNGKERNEREQVVKDDREERCNHFKSSKWGEYVQELSDDNDFDLSSYTESHSKKTKDFSVIEKPTSSLLNVSPIMPHGIQRKVLTDGTSMVMKCVTSERNKMVSSCEDSDERNLYKPTANNQIENIQDDDINQCHEQIGKGNKDVSVICNDDDSIANTFSSMDSFEEMFMMGGFEGENVTIDEMSGRVEKSQNFIKPEETLVNSFEINQPHEGAMVAPSDEKNSIEGDSVEDVVKSDVKKMGDEGKVFEDQIIEDNKKDEDDSSLSNLQETDSLPDTETNIIKQVTDGEHVTASAMAATCSLTDRETDDADEVKSFLVNSEEVKEILNDATVTSVNNSEASSLLDCCGEENEKKNDFSFELCSNEFTDSNVVEMFNECSSDAVSRDSNIEDKDKINIASHDVSLKVSPNVSISAASNKPDNGTEQNNKPSATHSLRIGWKPPVKKHDITVTDGLNFSQPDNASQKVKPTFKCLKLMSKARICNMGSEKKFMTDEATEKCEEEVFRDETSPRQVEKLQKCDAVSRNSPFVRPASVSPHLSGTNTAVLSVQQHQSSEISPRSSLEVAVEDVLDMQQFNSSPRPLNQGNAIHKQLKTPSQKLGCMLKQSKGVSVGLNGTSLHSGPMSKLKMVSPASLQFPNKADVEQAPSMVRQVYIPANFSSVPAYKQVLIAAVTEYLNCQLFEVARRYHQALSRVDISGYTTSARKETRTESNPPCQCGVPSKMVMVRKEGPNTGRYFYACSADRARQCKWADEKCGRGGSGGAVRRSIKDARSLGDYMKAQKIHFYGDCQLVKRSKENIKHYFKAPKWAGRREAMDLPQKKQLFLKLPHRDRSSLYAKDDIWVISSSVNFDWTNTFLARSTFYGPSSACEVEMDPLSGYTPSNWHSEAVCQTVLVGNASSELSYLENIQDHIQFNSPPLIPYLINRNPESCDREVGQRNFQAPRMNIQPQTGVHNVHIYSEQMDELIMEYVEKYGLNRDQAEAIRRVANMFCVEKAGRTDKLLLIHGVFGAGKSFLLAVMVLFLIRVFQLNDAASPTNTPFPWKLLISSTTNVAVDRILQGLLDLGFDEFVRVGSVKKIAKPVLPYSVHASGTDNQELKDLQEMLRSGELTSTEKSHVRQSIEKHRQGDNKKKLGRVRVVGATCAACSQACLTNMEFPFVMLDECSQMTEPASLLPIARFSCHRLVVVGDPKQLDPTIQGAESAHTNGLEQTLFDRLFSMGYIPTILRTQYRCHPQISQIANKLFYGEMLEDGVTVADRPPLLKVLPTVCFLDVDNGEECCEMAGSFYNEREAQFVVFLLQALLGAGLQPTQIGVITLYRSQMASVTILQGDEQEMKGVQVSTVDAFQGGERDVIILSCVRTNACGFIDKDKRTNVALTRARHHLVIVGNRSNLSKNLLWGKVISHCREYPEGIQSADEARHRLEVHLESLQLSGTCRSNKGSQQNSPAIEVETKPKRKRGRKKADNQHINKTADSCVSTITDKEAVIENSVSMSQCSSSMEENRHSDCDNVTNNCDVDSVATAASDSLPLSLSGGVTRSLSGGMASSDVPTVIPRNSQEVFSTPSAGYRKRPRFAHRLHPDQFSDDDDRLNPDQLSDDMQLNWSDDDMS